MIRNDEALRQLSRTYKDDRLEHAKYIKCGMRAGLFDLNRLALCAFLKHEPSQYAMADWDRGDNFIWFDRVLNRHEPLPMIKELRRWGSRVTIMAACGVIEYLSRRRHMGESYHLQPLGLLRAMIDYAQATTQQDADIGLRVIRGWHQQENPIMPAANRNAEGCLYVLQREIDTAARRSRIPPNPFTGPRRPSYPGLQICINQNVHLEDDILIEAMKKYIVPWALGDFA